MPQSLSDLGPALKDKYLNTKRKGKKKIRLASHGYKDLKKKLKGRKKGD